jgi:hypothetical protein
MGEALLMSSRTALWLVTLMHSDYTKGVFIVRAVKDKDLQALKHDVVKCFEGTAGSTWCNLKITEMMAYKGIRTT